MDGEKSTKCIIRDRNLRPSESQYKIDQHIKSHDRDNDPPPPKKKKNTPLLKGTKNLLNHCSTAPKSLPPPISNSGTNLKYSKPTQDFFFF